MNKQTHWEHIDLETYRQIADPEVDRLVAALLPKQGSESIGRLGYNSMLLIADKLIKDPELALVGSSRLGEWLEAMPEDLTGYFDPMEAPDWVDSEKLKRGSQLWQQYPLITLFILYSGSLPACYLMKNGIPALYKTEKLRDHQYIFQRIYETGLMLSSCMDEGGIKVVKDAAIQYDALLLQALHNLDKEGKWHQIGHQLVRRAGETKSPVDQQLLEQEIERLRGKRKRYLWGKGYITAKKVRFLHASMRYMLKHPDSFRPWGDKNQPQSYAERLSQVQTPWDTEKLGAPVNQEDLTYTLLTFGLVIPQGMKKWGVPLTREEKESFLHLWKVVGYIMGIHPELLTDDWDDAVSLYEKIQERQAGACEEGPILTEALMGFLGDYLPHVPGFAHRLSAAMIISQIGLTNASYILDKQLIDETQSFWRKPIYKLVGGLFTISLRLRARFYGRFKHLGGITSHRLHEASELLIASWRDAFSRKPFFVPVNTTTWLPLPGTNQAYAANLTEWRREIFAAVGFSLGLLTLSTFSLAATLPIALISGWPTAKLAFITAASTWIISIGIMQFRLPAIFNKRPKIDK
ncbi:MAG: oxygenase MpaB family protein [Methylococcaceae bacterium]